VEPSFHKIPKVFIFNIYFMAYDSKEETGVPSERPRLVLKPRDPDAAARAEAARAEKAVRHILLCLRNGIVYPALRCGIAGLSAERARSCAIHVERNDLFRSMSRRLRYSYCNT
jgi:hypothetical protein